MITVSDGPRICLASASPRRRALLAQLGLDAEVCPVDVDETRRPGESGDDYVRRLALEKGRAALGLGATPVVAADTAVLLGDAILGKPGSPAEAARMLGSLAGVRHRVVTAVAVLDHDREQVLVSRTGVKFRPMSDAEIQAYCATGEPLDKAGAYAIQGLAAAFISEIQGSYSGVMGLPLFETARLLESFGVPCLVAGAPAEPHRQCRDA